MTPGCWFRGPPAMTTKERAPTPHHRYNGMRWENVRVVICRARRRIIPRPHGVPATRAVQGGSQSNESVRGRTTASSSLIRHAQGRPGADDVRAAGCVGSAPGLRQALRAVPTHRGAPSVALVSRESAALQRPVRYRNSGCSRNNQTKTAVFRSCKPELPERYRSKWVGVPTGGGDLKPCPHALRHPLQGQSTGLKTPVRSSFFSGLGLKIVC